MHQDRPVPHAHCVPAQGSAPALIATLVAALALSGCAGFPWQKAPPPPSIRGGYAAGDKLMVILPAKGPVADAANAVREGLRAANGADDTAAKPALTFIANDDPKKMAADYKGAIGAGATQVIGPLLKPSVDVLAGGPALKVPTLALNQATTPGKPAANLYQFALAPETEAVDVANKAKARGFTRALMLSPKGEAGSRRADAFRRQWQKLGGTLVGEASLDPAAANLSKSLNALLHKGAADVLFLATDADQARKVFPAVRDGAVSLPVVATSAVYSGQPDPVRDKALTGLYFVDAPWVLGVGAADDPLARAKLKRGSSALATPLGLRLYAMGIDAYRLAPRLSTLAKDAGATFPGESGTLSIDSAGRVQRQLTLAQFTASGPQPAPAMVAAKPGVPATAAPADQPAKPAKPAKAKHPTKAKPATKPKPATGTEPAAPAEPAAKAEPPTPIARPQRIAPAPRPEPVTPAPQPEPVARPG
ncbi:penicillin-binding protein activator [uncultured Thiodictyon sp.]|uniref:penicillin-binding protein activator n=1 Tax=uncultured Thiodictyon sp. TaxID=1846217 RepID=UPI0025F3EB67|nr:penicillin-binding protein activator [uncultured Thiodictyon sp.]